MSLIINPLMMNPAVSEWNPLQEPSLELWLSTRFGGITTGTYGGNAVATGIPDLSGKGRHASALAANAPRYFPNDVNGFPGLGRCGGFLKNDNVEGLTDIAKWTAILVVSALPTDVDTEVYQGLWCAEGGPGGIYEDTRLCMEWAKNQVTFASFFDDGYGILPTQGHPVILTGLYDGDIAVDVNLMEAGPAKTLAMRRMIQFIANGICADPITWWAEYPFPETLSILNYMLGATGTDGPYNPAPDDTHFLEFLLFSDKFSLAKLNEIQGYLVAPSVWDIRGYHMIYAPMSSNTSPSPQIASATSDYGPYKAPWRAFCKPEWANDLDVNQYGWESSVAPTVESPQDLIIDVGESTRVSFYNLRNTDNPDESPATWTIDGLNGEEEWEEIDSVVADTNDRNEWKFPQPGKAITGSYSQFRIRISSTTGGGSNRVRVFQFALAVETPEINQLASPDGVTLELAVLGLDSIQLDLSLPPSANPPILTAGICWNMTGNPTTEDTCIVSTVIHGPVTTTLSVEGGNTYYCRPYAITPFETVYGAVITYSAPQLLYEPMTANDAPSPQVASATTEYGGYPAYKAADGNDSTFFSSNAGPWDDPVEWQLSLGEEKHATHYNIICCASGYNAQSWKFRGRRLGSSTWEDIDIVVDNMVDTAGQPKFAGIGKAIDATYADFKISCSKTTGGHNNFGMSSFILVG